MGSSWSLLPHLVTNGVAKPISWSLEAALLDAKDRGGKGNPLRHQLHRTPTPAHQALRGQEAGAIPSQSPGSWEWGGRKEVRPGGESLKLSAKERATQSLVPAD